MFKRKKRGFCKKENYFSFSVSGINRKGEITSFYLISLILAIVGFIVVLLLLFSLRLDNFEEDNICKLSVLSRGTAPLGQGLIPLQCTTKKICVTDKGFGKGTCKQFLGEPKGNIINIKLEGGGDKEKADFLSGILAQGLYNCWTQMGEGKLDLFNGEKDISGIAFEDVLGIEAQKKSSCVICSRVALADDLIKDGKVVDGKKGILSKLDLAGYMNERGPKGETRTYLQLLTDRQIIASQNELSESLKINSKNKDEIVMTDEIAFIFSQILVNSDSGEAALKAGKRTTIAIGGTLFFSPLGKVTGLYGVVGTLFGGAIASGVSYFNAEKNLEVMASKCNKFSKGSKDGDRIGCSLVRPFDFNKISEINDACGKIEGNP